MIDVGVWVEGGGTWFFFNTCNDKCGCLSRKRGTRTQMTFVGTSLFNYWATNPHLKYKLSLNI